MHPPVVEDGQDDAEQHLQHAEQHRDLHLEGVLEGDPIGGDLPDGVEAEAVRRAVETGAVLGRQQQRLRVVVVDLLVLEAVAPGRAEDVDRFGEDVVVDEAGVDGEQAHQQDDVAAAKEDGGDLSEAGRR